MYSVIGVLYSGPDGNENLPKAVSDLMHKLLTHTFAVGVAWLTQMYNYLLNMSTQDVKNYLLSPENSHHLIHHQKFLNAVEPEFHRVLSRGVQLTLSLMSVSENRSRSL